MKLLPPAGRKAALAEAAARRPRRSTDPLLPASLPAPASPRRLRLRPAVIMALALSALRSTVGGQSLAGLTLTGNNFSYNAADGLVTGIFLRPSGEGPFPAVLVSHGKGGSATAFSLQHAQTLVQWGFVCIGPNYTHANSGSTPDDEGYSPENSRRARRALEVLAATPGVDAARIAAFSHSMGSFLTLGLAGELPARFRAVAIAAGGTSGTANTALASPATQEVQAIRTPLLMFHGTADTTVSPVQSANLQAILQANGVPHQRLLYQGVNHNILDPPIRREDAYAIMRAWFTRHGVLSASGNTAPTISAPATMTAVAGVASAPLAITVGDAETPAAALTLQAFSLDSDVAATAQGAAYAGRLTNSGLVLGGTGTNRTLTVTPRAGQTGTVEVALVVTEPAGSMPLAAVTFLHVTIQAAGATPPVSTGDARLVNLSARAGVTPGEPLIAGFVLAGTGTRTLLIRAVGPTLADFGVPGVLANPRLQLFRGDTASAANNDWADSDAARLAQAAAAVGAFALPAASRDAALLVALPAGAYSAHALSASDSGLALVEIYDTGGDATARLANLSVRTRPGPGGDPVIAGFVVAGSGARALLIRAVGPALAEFGVGDPLPDPDLQLFAGATLQLSNGDWGQSVAAMLAIFGTQAGAFPLPAGSKDAALGAALGGGAYTAVVTPAIGTRATGTTLVEIYAP
jgi:dienelactone hydrolase